MDGHTPGPWIGQVPGQEDAHMCRIYARKDGAYIQLGATWHPEVILSYVGLTRAECAANARLMAAAPDLLAACKALREGLDDYWVTLPEGLAALAMYDAAIAGAGG